MQYVQYNCDNSEKDSTEDNNVTKLMIFFLA